MKIAVNDAHLKTAIVEIKSLVVSGKQMTLAVFRQIEGGGLINYDTGRFNGVPWGTVRYCPDEACKYLSGHLHVVWQKGSELRRTTVAHPAWKFPKPIPIGVSESEYRRQRKREIALERAGLDCVVSPDDEDEVSEYRRRWRRWEELNALPQLFIAV